MQELLVESYKWERACRLRKERHLKDAKAHEEREAALKDELEAAREHSRMCEASRDAAKKELAYIQETEEE